MIQKKYRIAVATYALIESLITALSFVAAYYLRAQLPGDFFGKLFPFRDYLGLFVVIILLWIILFFLVRQRKADFAEDWVEITQETLLAVVTGTVLISAAIFIFKYDFISRPFIVIFAVVNFLFLSGFRYFTKSGASHFKRILAGERRVLIVGTEERAGEVARVLEAAQQWGYKLVGVVQESPQALLDERLKSYPIIPLDMVPKVLNEHVIDEVIFAVSKEALSRLEEIFLLCEEDGIKTRVMLSFFPHVTSKIYLEALKGLPLLTFSTTPENDYLLFIKGTIDLLLASLFMVALSPLLLLISILIKLTSRGPAIFTQVRSGLGGRKFDLYKFRSMISNAEEVREDLQHLNEMTGPVFKLRNDPRCTPLGWWLRKFSLDELPQLINILKGDMSFVGPRPPLPEEVERYERWQRRRLRMKPGLTCLWQVQGRNTIDFEEWMRLDLQYIDNWSLFLDLKIILQTIPIVLLGRGR
jgi:exopolysaccharide biosynthesis polyprenyl glycosylphosphotransferase